ncbi:uncharacterized protein FOMMEDRAFT_170884 [Fomitiporia mediterranea MF3/22]|uniref:uncharacterized protein n=1 Tax=Fomitiporia mediterranea (strain MF3/22) TaxID=694068 RepID=UPI0004407727|nr:uncharacterized protein FOMMEDRAFT_170884 [Fomitiporia mediterranea MF3/22]EJC98645.1 hypothetical protein FOMMEDRAFT_170884 [Fomitiporia mediterranea MF3/22]
MPARTDGSINTTTYRSSLALPTDALNAMKRDPRSNIISSKIEKYRAMEGRGFRLQPDEFWIVCSTTRTTSRGSEDKTVDFVLACTYGVVGKYPIFIWGTKLEDDLTDEYLEVRMRNVVSELLKNVSPRRVYSIFAVQPVAQSFAAHWSSATRISIIPEPYYAAKFSYCTTKTLAPAPSANGVIMRVAEDHDTEQVAHLCYGFAADSPPFVLTNDGARAEARTMIQAKQVWVLEVQHSRGSSIACIVALTRANANVMAITKVYTPPEWRQRGYARRLVRKVCDHLFTVEHKDYVVLYVGHDNSAANVYNRVGFVALEPGTQSQFRSVENWLELGFDRAKIDLGHW